MNSHVRRLWLLSRRKAFFLRGLLLLVLLLAFSIAILSRTRRITQEPSERNRTVSAHGAIRAALEQYKEKFGDYPESAALSEVMLIKGKECRTGGAHMLYQAITGDGSSAIKLALDSSVAESDGIVDDTERENTINLSSLPKSVIYPNLAAELIQVRILVDGWGHPFQYTKAHPDPARNMAVNPDYDLWSYGSKPPAGATVPTWEEKMNPAVSSGWVKSW